MSTVTEPQKVADARIERMRSLESEGLSRKQIAAQYGISRQRVAQLLGPLESKGQRKEIHVYAVPEAFTHVADVADSYGLHNRAGQTAGKGSVGLLLEQVWQGNLVIVRPEDVCGEDQTGDVQEDRGGTDAQG